MYAGLDLTGWARPSAHAQRARSRRSLSLAAAAFLSLLGASRVSAMTAEGTLITNLASATANPTTAGIPQLVTGVITYGVTATVGVANPTVMLNKTATPTIQATGGVVTFCITFSNSSDYVSAFNIVIRDIAPNNMGFVDWWTQWVDDPSAIPNPPDYSYNAGTLWTTGTPIVGRTVAARWSVPALGPGRSGYVCYRASVL